MNSIQAIQKQIDAASPILERIATLTPAPDRSYLVSGSQSTGKKRYDKVIVVHIEEISQSSIKHTIICGRTKNK